MSVNGDRGAGGGLGEEAAGRVASLDIARLRVSIRWLPTIDIRGFTHAFSPCTPARPRARAVDADRRGADNVCAHGTRHPQVSRGDDDECEDHDTAGRATDHAHA